MVPHFEATLPLKRHPLATEMHAAMLEDALAQLAIGVLIVARSGHVLYANRAAEVAMGDIGNAAGPAVVARLVQEMIARPDGRFRTIPRGPARRPLVVRAVPVSGQDSAHLPASPPQTGVAVFLRDPDREPHIDTVDLAGCLGLTPREASLARLLAADLSLSEVATTLGISRENARTHLKRILSKTGARRQAELVALVLRLQT